MQTYTATNKTLTKGISLTKTPKLGWALILGEYGHGKWQEHVKLDNRRPPEITLDVEHPEQSGMIHESGTVSFDAVGRQRHAFTIPNAEDNRKLIHINTGNVYMKGHHGKTTATMGRPRLIVAGWGAFGENGENGTWEDCLWTIKQNDAILVRPSGGQFSEPYVVHNNGVELVRYSPEDFRMYVVNPFISEATPDQLRVELRSAEYRKDTKMIEVFRSAVHDASNKTVITVPASLQIIEDSIPVLNT